MAASTKDAKLVLIGEQVNITNPKNQSLGRIFGQVTDETRNTIQIMTKNGKKTVIKDQVEIMIQNKKINGKDITGRTEERIKQ